MAGLEDTVELLRNSDEATALDEGIADLNAGRSMMRMMSSSTCTTEGGLLTVTG